MIDCDTYRTILDESGEICLIVRGKSMEPMLHNELDMVIIKKTDEINSGDIIFYQGPFGRPILHRVLDYKDGFLTLRGDSNPGNDFPVSPMAVIGKVVEVVRDEKHYEEDSAFFVFYKKLALSKAFRASKRIKKLIRKRVNLK